MVVQSHYRLYPVPLWRPRRNPEPSVRFGRSYVRMHEAKVVGGSERGRVQVFGRDRMVCWETTQEVRMSASDREFEFVRWKPC